MLNIGIHLDPPYLLASLIEKGRKGVVVRSLQACQISQPDDVKRLYTENFKGKIHTGLSAAELLVRPFEIEIGDSRYLEEAIAFQAEATSHLPAKEFLTVPWIKPNQKDKQKTESLLLTVPRESLRSHLDQCGALGFDPDSVSVVSTALCHFLQWKAPLLSNAFLVHLGSCEWTCIWVQDGVLKKSYCIGGGTEALLLTLWEDRKRIHLQKEIGNVARQIDLLQFKPHLNLHLAQKLDEMRQELSKVIHSFHRDAGQQPLLFTGRVDAFANFPEFLTYALAETVSLDKLDLFSAEEQKFAVGLGLALEQTSKRPLQFLKEEFFPRKNWRKLGLYGLSILGTSLLLSLGLLGLAMKGLEVRKTKMMASLQNSLEKWDADLVSKDPDTLLSHWVKAVETNTVEYPYIPRIPQTAEVLAWLSSHPLFQSASVGEVHYRLIQFPHIGALKDPYAAQVEIEFQVGETTDARRIHEALLKGDALVDATKEIKWEARRDSYRAVFFLKNRGPYVP